MFKRRTKRSWARVAVEIFYPRGGWRRAASYMGHRLSRLPDTPDRIARGIAAGMFASCTPFYGLHFVIAALSARALGGNILAALLGTFLGNPLTFPLIVETSVQVGSWMLGLGGGLHFPQVMAAFGYAWAELWSNLYALVTGGAPNWFRLRLFTQRVFLPYLLGGVPLGLITGTAVYFVSLPLIRAYQTRRRERLRQRFIASRRTSRGAPARPPSDGDADG
ncbi:MAG: DUF2062 domain-containing protein [Alkalilacustris sp.]